MNSLKYAIETEKSDQDWWNDPQMINYENAIKALTGLLFMVLGFSIMINGTKLESSITEKLDQHATTSNSSSRSSSMNKSSHGETTAGNHLETRILTITITLTLIFFSRSFCDILYTFNLLNVQFNNPKVDFILILFTEVIPCLLISKMMRKRDPSSQPKSKFSDIEQNK